MRKFIASTTLYALDLLCMVMAISLIGFSLYILPFLLGHDGYDVPAFIVRIADWYQTHHSLNGLLTLGAVVLPFFIAGIGFILVSRWITVYLETHEIEPGLPHVDEDDYAEHVRQGRSPKQGNHWVTFGVVGFMLAILVLLGLLEYYVVISIL